MKKVPLITFLSLMPFVVSAATLSLSPSSQTVSVGDTFNVTVNLDTQGASIDGVDLRYISYDSSLLQVLQVTPGSLMPTTLVNSINSSLGRLTFSQITAGGSTYSGSGVLATINFKALSTGTANATISYTSGNTTDSNVASAGTDILSAVVNGVYTINSGSTSTPPPSSSSGGGSSAGIDSNTVSYSTGSSYTNTNTT